ncbi:hypothetical protein BS47DRAFT_1353205 [Hydnum rufescens UP504]|uniref:Uncharacterized protein n=1 Tax=Hydnum rufescens UP504 TaxID=1448309 RepID=A0A9P6DLS4_9AGAM|nr:hypothetical protein BS47DRAFT_1353205 [Hydnum rufescens UP504]
MHARPILLALAPSRTVLQGRPLDFTIGGEDTYHQHQNSEPQASRGLYNSFFPWSPAEWTEDSDPYSGIVKKAAVFTVVVLGENGMGRLEVMAVRLGMKM